MNKYDIELPNYPSELLQLALNDIKDVNENKNYKIDGTVWHKYDKKKGICTVCLGGAVLANTIEVDIKFEMPKIYEELENEIGVDNAKKLDIIDGIRQLLLSCVYHTSASRTLTSIEIEWIEHKERKILKKLKKFGDRRDIERFKDFRRDIERFKDVELSHEFYSSIIDDIIILDTSILGMENL